jgi:hypothetical protein
MAKAGRYWWQRQPLLVKRQYNRAKAGRPAYVMYECRLCRVKVADIDREGHLRRNHGPTAHVLVVFRVVKTNG